VSDFTVNQNCKKSKEKKKGRPHGQKMTTFDITQIAAYLMTIAEMRSGLENA
jgi:hypothetical protein